MTQARQQFVPPHSPVIVHCVQRCVRRAFLCGVDHYSGHSFEHRKDWVEQRLFDLAGCFAVALHGYAVMSNHVHVVLQVEPEAADRWSDQDVAERWVRLFPPREEGPIAFEQKRDRLLGNAGRLVQCRQRLASLSWFMRCLAEPLARRANREDGCKGRFWEGRFKCQRLLDERAVIAALAYVDLNPVRAGMADTLAACAHTSLARRLLTDNLAAPMKPLAGVPVASCVPLATVDYLALVDWTGRQLAPGKRGVLRGPVPRCLGRLGAKEKRWATEVRGIGSGYWRAVGQADRLLELAEQLGQRWLKGIGFARGLSKA